MTGTKCRGICNRTDEGFVKSSSYRDGRLKKCSICDAYLKNSFDRCPCCHNRLSNKSKSKKDKRTQEGDQAFLFFDLAIMRAKNELGLLSKCHSITALGEGFIQSVVAFYSDAINQLSILEGEGRQRPEYIKAKRKLLERFREKMLEKIKEYWTRVYS